MGKWQVLESQVCGAGIGFRLVNKGFWGVEWGSGGRGFGVGWRGFGCWKMQEFWMDEGLAQ